MRRALAGIAIALACAGVLAQWLAPAQVAAWLLAGNALCG